MHRIAICSLLILLALTPAARARELPSGITLSKFGAGDGPRQTDAIIHMLDTGRTSGQSNAMAFPTEHAGAHERLRLACQIRVLEGGDGGAITFLNTSEYGGTGPAPFVASWVEPNLRGSFAVGIDVHNPPNEEPFGPWGNYQKLPEREVSLHWDGREIVKRLAPAEFRGDFAPWEIVVRHVAGGAEVTVRAADATVYDAYFIAGMLPYESRLAFGAGTRADASTEFDVKDIELTATDPAAPRRPPLHVEVFNHVLTDNSKTWFEAEVSLPPANWAFGRVLLTLDIHDAGKSWDEWDRNGEISIVREDGSLLGIVPFITSYRTECHWEVDVTHFRPLLAGKTRLRIAAGTTFYKNRGYMMSVSLDYYHGAPPITPTRTVPLWVGTARYKSAENHFSDFFDSKQVTFDEDVRAAKVFVTTTGHSQIGEFTPSERSISFAPDATFGATQHRFENTLWKSDCYLNPNRPQYGTWKYSRAGWAPGDVVRPWWIDITPHLATGKTAQFTYTPEPYDFSGTPEDQRPKQDQINQASHVVRAYLVLYGDTAEMTPAPTMVISNVAEGSNAEKAGVKKGDYLSTYEGATIDSVDDLRAAIAGAAAASRETVKIVVFRNGERLELELKPGRMGVNLGSP